MFLSKSHVEQQHKSKKEGSTTRPRTQETRTSARCRRGNTFQNVTHWEAQENKITKRLDKKNTTTDKKRGAMPASALLHSL